MALKLLKQFGPGLCLCVNSRKAWSHLVIKIFGYTSEKEDRSDGYNQQVEIFRKQEKISAGVVGLALRIPDRV